MRKKNGFVFPLERLLQRSKTKEQVIDRIEGEGRMPTPTLMNEGRPKQRITVEELNDSLDEQGEHICTAMREDWVQPLVSIPSLKGVCHEIFDLQFFS